MKEFFKWWTIANTVWEIVSNFTKAGGPGINSDLVAQEAYKEIERRVFSGFLPKDTLNGVGEIIATAIDNHPAIQNHPK